MDLQFLRFYEVFGFLVVAWLYGLYSPIIAEDIKFLRFSVHFQRCFILMAKVISCFTIMKKSLKWCGETAYRLAKIRERLILSNCGKKVMVSEKRSSVWVVMGCDSYLTVMQGGIEQLGDFGVKAVVRIILTHKPPQIAAEFAGWLLIRWNMTLKQF